MTGHETGVGWPNTSWLSGSYFGRGPWPREVSSFPIWIYPRMWTCRSVAAVTTTAGLSPQVGLGGTRKLYRRAGKNCEI